MESIGATQTEEVFEDDNAMDDDVSVEDDNATDDDVYVEDDNAMFDDISVGDPNDDVFNDEISDGSFDEMSDSPSDENNKWKCIWYEMKNVNTHTRFVFMWSKNNVIGHARWILKNLKFCQI